MNRLQLRRTLSLAVPAGTAHTSLTVLATLQKNLEALGYALSPALFARLATVGSEGVASLYIEVVDELKRLRGAHYMYKPLYPNYPAQVMALDEARLYCNAILHYAGLATQFGIRTPRPSSQERPHLQQIALVEPDAFETLVIRLLRARTPYSPQDRDDIALLFAQAPTLAVASLPDELPNKEAGARRPPCSPKCCALATSAGADGRCSPTGTARHRSRASRRLRPAASRRPPEHPSCDPSSG